MHVCTHGQKATVTNSIVSFCQACADEILAEMSQEQNQRPSGTQQNQSPPGDKKK